MEENKVNSKHEDWIKIEKAYRNRVRKYEVSAFVDMVIIIVTLFSCVTIFAFGDKLSELVFKSPEQKRAEAALIKAEAEIYHSVASLADPLSEFIRSLPPKVRPILDERLIELLGKEQNTDLLVDPIQQKDISTVPSDITGEHEVKEMQKNDVLAQGAVIHSQERIYETGEAIYPKHDTGLTERNLVSSVKGGVNISKPLSLSETDQLVEIYEDLLSLHDKYSKLHSQLMYERDKEVELYVNADIAQIKADADIEIANDKNWTDQEIAESKADADVEIAEIKADAEIEIAENRAYEKTTRAEELNALVLGVFTKTGSVVMVIWLIRIFVKKRQRSVKVASFYLAVADAIALSKEKDPAAIGAMIKHLFPASMIEEDASETPIEQAAKIVAAVIQRE